MVQEYELCIEVLPPNFVPRYVNVVKGYLLEGELNQFLPNSIGNGLVNIPQLFLGLSPLVTLE